MPNSHDNVIALPYKMVRINPTINPIPIKIYLMVNPSRFNTKKNEK